MKYKANTRINTGEGLIEPGKTIELDEDAAAPLLDIQAISEIARKTAEKKTPAK